MPTVNDDVGLKQHFLDKLTEHYNQRKEGFFVTDFTYCLRKAYWRRVNPKPCGERELGYFVDGNRRHGALQVLSEFRSEVSVQKYGIRGRLDFLSDTPIEMKTTRARKRNSIPDYYLKQCAYYCVLTGINSCTLMVQYILDECFSFQKITFSPQELKEYNQELVYKLNLLKQALQIKDHTILPEGERWQCTNSKGDCEYYNECHF